MKLFTLLSFLISLQAYAFAQLRYYETFRSRDWGYSNNIGPSMWSSSRKECNGNSQSPIDIKTATTTANRDPIQFSNYNIPTDSLTLENNGNTAMITVGAKRRPTISSSLFGGNVHYILDEFHFHWGKTSVDGSEHRINGNSYPFELHLVHYNRAYKSIDDALGKPNGVAALGILFSISKTSNPHLNSIVNNLKKVKNANQTTSIPSIIVNNLLPQHHISYRYSGSLTTPPCSENVNWAVFEHTVAISENQIKQFRNLLDNSGKPLVDNVRPPQKLNGRKITKFPPISTTPRY